MILNENRVVEIAEANTSDNDNITRLYGLLYPEQPNKNTGKYYGVNSANKVFVAKVNGQVVGFVITTFISYLTSKTGYIEELIVDPAFRGEHIGKMLAEKALEWHKSLNTEVVFVTTDRAEGFYKKLGFKNPIKNVWLFWVPPGNA